MNMMLRPYQRQCVDLIVAQFKDYQTFLSQHTTAEIDASEALQCQLKQVQTALIVLPTAAGKTICFCSAEIEIRQLLECANQGLNTLIIAHRKELLEQARDKYQLLIPDAHIGLVGDGIAEYGAPITVASVQTISRPNHLKNLKLFGYQLVIVDEAHHDASSTYQHVHKMLPYAFTLMVTATPDRLDGKPIINHPPLFQQSILDMIPSGYLCNLKCIAVRTNTSLDGISRRMGDYNERELAEVIDNPMRNQRVVDAYKEHCAGRQFLCFSVTVAHAEHLSAAFQASGIRAAVISGKTSSDLRSKLLQDYQTGTIQGLVNCGVLTEGTDLPVTSCILLARPTQSRALFVQCLGRGLRLAPNKENCILLDMTDNVLTHKLEPMTLSKSLGKQLKNGESILEMLVREEEEKKRERERKEADEREKRERMIRQKQRQQDLVIDLLTRFDWKQNEAGYRVLEVGPHRIALIPTEDPELWQVGARLATSNFKFQMWRETPMPLHDALDFASQEAERIMANANYVHAVDRYNPRNRLLATEKQIAFLDRNNIPYPRDLYGNCTWTKIQASQAIGTWIEEKNAGRSQKTPTPV